MAEGNQQLPQQQRQQHQPQQQPQPQFGKSEPPTFDDAQSAFVRSVLEQECQKSPYLSRINLIATSTNKLRELLNCKNSLEMRMVPIVVCKYITRLVLIHAKGYLPDEVSGYLKPENISTDLASDELQYLLSHSSSGESGIVTIFLKNITVQMLGASLTSFCRELKLKTTVAPAEGANASSASTSTANTDSPPVKLLIKESAPPPLVPRPPPVARYTPRFDTMNATDAATPTASAYSVDALHRKMPKPQQRSPVRAVGGGSANSSARSSPRYDRSYNNRTATNNGEDDGVSANSSITGDDDDSVNESPIRSLRGLSDPETGELMLLDNAGEDAAGTTEDSDGTADEPTTDYGDEAAAPTDEYEDDNNGSAPRDRIREHPYDYDPPHTSHDATINELDDAVNVTGPLDADVDTGDVDDPNDSTTNTMDIDSGYGNPSHDNPDNEYNASTNDDRSNNHTGAVADDYANRDANNDHPDQDHNAITTVNDAAVYEEEAKEHERDDEEEEDRTSNNNNRTDVVIADTGVNLGDILAQVETAAQPMSYSAEEEAADDGGDDEAALAYANAAPIDQDADDGSGAVDDEDDDPDVEFSYGEATPPFGGLEMLDDEYAAPFGIGGAQTPPPPRHRPPVVGEHELRSAWLRPSATNFDESVRAVTAAATTDPFVDDDELAAMVVPAPTSKSAIRRRKRRILPAPAEMPEERIVGGVDAAEAIITTADEPRLVSPPKRHRRR